MTSDDARVLLSASTSGWFKARRSGGQNGCVEVNYAVPGYAGIRDSKLGTASPVFVLSRTGMTELLARTAEGRFDGPNR